MIKPYARSRKEMLEGKQSSATTYEPQKVFGTPHADRKKSSALHVVGLILELTKIFKVLFCFYRVTVSWSSILRGHFFARSTLPTSLDFLMESTFQIVETCLLETLTEINSTWLSSTSSEHSYLTFSAHK